MKHPGITAIAHPLNPEVATRHGVFVFEDVNSIRKKYRESKQTLFLQSKIYLKSADTACPSAINEVKMFLHKVSIEKMKAYQAIISETNQVTQKLCHSFFCVLTI